MTKQERLPFESTIHISTNWQERHATLLTMKDKKLQGALRFIVEWTRYLDLAAPFAESSQFVASDGFFCSLEMDVIPFEGVQSTKQVFDALQYFLINMEISILEILGEVIVREDDGSRHQGVFQNRFNSRLRNGAQAEMNVAMFTQFYGGGDNRKNE
uniref:Uncharacterized protein n=1 Tax=Globisporangium ultimum (strain ATCC 200006 / CBS 805.95 / DAOM BR144) TaxID=431595 RepID=K3X392_GLOUD